MGSVLRHPQRQLPPTPQAGRLPHSRARGQVLPATSLGVWGIELKHQSFLFISLSIQISAPSAKCFTCAISFTVHVHQSSGCPGDTEGQKCSFKVTHSAERRSLTQVSIAPPLPLRC